VRFFFSVMTPAVEIHNHSTTTGPPALYIMPRTP
jgi:hypothetical protein